MRLSIFITCIMLTMSATAQQVALHMEHLFPDSPYRKVYGSCTDLWCYLRTVQEKISGPQEQFNDGMVDALVGLDSQVKQLADHKRTMPDDVEHLLGVLQVMHGEYVYTMLQKSDEIGAVHAVSYFFKRIKQRLEKLLTVVTS